MAVMVLLAVAHVCFWAVALILGFRAGVTGAAGAGLVAVWLALIGTWIALVGYLSRTGWLTGPGVSTLPWLWVPTPALAITLVAVLAVPTLREALLGSVSVLPPVAIPALHSLRILAAGTVMKAWRGKLPRRIGFGVGIPDMAFGLWSFSIALRGGFPDAGMAFIWHVAGAVILLLMVPMVFTVLRPPRLDAPDKGDARAILAFPLVLAPAGLAVSFLVLHALALWLFFVPIGPATGVR